LREMHKWLPETLRLLWYGKLHTITLNNVGQYRGDIPVQIGGTMAENSFPMPENENE
jgi:hypothetical protein